MAIQKSTAEGLVGAQRRSYLNRAITLASFHSLGNTDSDMDLLNIYVKGVTNSVAHNLTRRGGKLSGPPDFLGFI